MNSHFPASCFKLSLLTMALLNVQAALAAEASDTQALPVIQLQANTMSSQSSEQTQAYIVKDSNSAKCYRVESEY